MGFFRKITRFFSTVRHLKPIQIVARAQFIIFRPKPNLTSSPSRGHLGLMQPFGQRRPSMVAPGQFLFLNQLGALSELGWDGVERDKLWRYNQHYFDDLNATDAILRQTWHIDLISAWITSNPPGTGTGWEPYPTSLRIVNWIKWAARSEQLTPEMQNSLAIQVRWLDRRIEWHLLGNHLFSNAKALIFAGLFFSGQEADSWLEKGRRILDVQIREQFLDDGGHFELSPMYHALALEDVLDLVNIMRSAGPRLSAEASVTLTALARLVPKTMRWLQVMSHPDGCISFFNDAAFGIALDNSELASYAARLGFGALEGLATGAIQLEATGYARLERGTAVVLVDMAKIGPDYLPGHAHADTLTFEMSLDEQRLFVNSGTSIYGTGADRLRQRGTAAHNTIEIGGVNSSDVWSGFRVGRRAYPQRPVVISDEDSSFAEAHHNGYRHLHRDLLHRRKWKLEEGRLTVIDTLTRQDVCALVRFHLHPEIAVHAASNGQVLLRLPNGRIVSARSYEIDINIVGSTWHPEFGLSIPNQCLIARVPQGHACFEFTWD